VIINDDVSDKKMAFCALDKIQFNSHLPEVKRFTEKYYLKKTIIQGQFNAVAYGQNKKTHQKVVIKSIYSSEPNNHKEVTILKQLQHVTGIIQYIDCFTIKPDIQFIVMEYFGQMNLHHFLRIEGPLPEKIAHAIFKQLSTTVLHCYQHRILHRKLKPSNILINIRTNKIKIGNFNSASQFSSEKEEFTSQLNNDIAPPEYFQSKKYTADGLYTWSLGLILFEMLFKMKPFESSIDAVCNPLCIPPHAQQISIIVLVLLKKLLGKSNRIRLNDLYHHPWINKIWI